jgi:hypothetical protein
MDFILLRVRGTGTTDTILETKRIAVDTEGGSLDKQWVVMETSSLNVSFCCKTTDYSL